MRAERTAIGSVSAFILASLLVACEEKPSSSAVTRHPSAPRVTAVASARPVSSGEHGAPGAPPNGSECDNAAIPASTTPTRFAVIGDFGTGGAAEGAVAKLVKSWKPEFVLTTGDNNYPSGAADTIDANIGQFFHELICPYRGSYGAGATRNRFFPALGNHDWYTDDAAPYLDYFSLPGNERYYEVLWGNVHVFALDSDTNEPDGVTSSSRQAQWLKDRLAASTARWQIVTMHHPPFSSGPHASTSYMQWPFKQWGVDLVLAGHDHDYERFAVDGLPYLVVGLGGQSIYQFDDRAEGSDQRFNSDYGAMLVEAEPARLVARFFTTKGERVDELVLGGP